MKKAYIILGITLLTLLTSCKVDIEGSDAEKESASNVEVKQTTLESKEIDMAELTGSVVIDTNHSLAGKTLIFDVEIISIGKGDGNTAETIENGDSIEVHYTGTLENGEVFDSSRPRNQTLGFTVGAGQMIKGFDAGVVGMKKDELKSLTLAPADAYGEHDPERLQTFPKKDLASFVAAGYKLEVGEKLPTQYGEFEIVEVINEDTNTSEEK